MSGDENNIWLDNPPVEGDSTAGFGGRGIDVHPDGVKRFSTQAEAEAKQYSSGFADGVMPLMQASAQIGASFQEAAQFAGRHAQAFTATTMLSRDVTIGLAALGMGARTIAINYLNSDATSAATLPDVLGAFDTSGGNGLREQIEQAQQAPAETGNDNTVRLPEPQPVDADDFTNPNDPGFANTIDLGDNASYTIPGAPDCLDIEMAGPETTQGVQAQYQDDLATVDYEQAPYDPDSYR